MGNRVAYHIGENPEPFKLPEILYEIARDIPFFSSGNYNVYGDREALPAAQFQTQFPRQFLITNLCINSSLRIGRPTGAAIICAAGIASTGKSTTINELFGEAICQVSDLQSVSSVIASHEREVIVRITDPNIHTKLFFLDLPGHNVTNDTQSYKDTIRKFRRAFKHLENRYYQLTHLETCKIKEQISGLTFRDSNYPNVVLFHVSATEPRFQGPNSRVRLALGALKDAGYVDTVYPNVIVVLTRVMSHSPNPDHARDHIERVSAILKREVNETLGIYNVPVVPIENIPNWGSGQLPQAGEFHVLPNGEVNYVNLFLAIDAMLTDNGDALGKLLTGTYFQPRITPNN